MKPRQGVSKTKTKRGLSSKPHSKSKSSPLQSTTRHSPLQSSTRRKITTSTSSPIQNAINEASKTKTKQVLRNVIPLYHVEVTADEKSAPSFTPEQLAAFTPEQREFAQKAQASHINVNIVAPHRDQAIASNDLANMKNRIKLDGGEDEFLFPTDENFKIVHLAGETAPESLHDQYFNPEEHSDYEDHFAAPPSHVTTAFPFATTPYTITLRFAEYENTAFKFNIYEGETVLEAAHRNRVPFPTLCDPKDIYLESEFREGPPGCGLCMGFFPPTYVNALRPRENSEIDALRKFLRIRVDTRQTNRDVPNGGAWERMRYLCVTQMTPEMNGVEVLIPGSKYPFSGISTEESGEPIDLNVDNDTILRGGNRFSV